MQYCTYNTACKNHLSERNAQDKVVESISLWPEDVSNILASFALIGYVFKIQSPTKPCYMYDLMQRLSTVSLISYLVQFVCNSGGSKGGRGGTAAPSEISASSPVPPPQKKVQDKADTCQNFLLKL